MTPEETARRCAELMWADDRASQSLDMQLVEVGPGRATLRMEVRADMVNGHGIGHGGLTFTLADSAFAFACNSHNRRTVAAGAEVRFRAPTRLGDVLIATAVERSREGRDGVYDVTVTRDDVLVADFTGHSREIGGAFFGGEEAWVDPVRTTGSRNSLTSARAGGGVRPDLPRHLQNGLHMRPLGTSARRLSACGVLLLSFLAASGTTGSPTAASSSPQQDQCVDGVSALRQRAGQRQGEDPNSVTAGQAQRLDDRLQQEVAKLKRSGDLNKDGSLRNAKRAFTIKTHFHVITREDGTGGVTRQQLRDQVEVLNESFAGTTSNKSARSPFRFDLASVDVTANGDWLQLVGTGRGRHRRRGGQGRAAPRQLGRPQRLRHQPRALPRLRLLPPGGPAGPRQVWSCTARRCPAARYAPYNEGDTLTHEVGHWMNLMHTFENGCTAPGDHVADTPYQADGDDIFYCNEDDDTCSQPGRDPVHDFDELRRRRRAWTACTRGQRAPADAGSWLGQRFRQ